MFNGTRLTELGYAGTVRDYITLTISAGRPARSNPEWPQVMPTWSQDYGGPLRPDQVEDLVAFVMNWGCDYDEKCAEPGIVAAATAGPTPTPAPTPEPIDLAEFVAGLPDGDAARGEELYLGTVTLLDGKAGACNACHTVDGSTLVGPSFTHVNADMPAGYPSLDVYLVESIFYPNAYKVPGFEAAQMPLNFFERFKAPDDEQGLQDMADLIAFIKSVAE
jgi:mono/diheme cytochrome c family protein